MQRSHVTKLLLIAVLLIASGVSLYPTFQLGGIRQQENDLIASVSDLTGLSIMDIDAAVIAGDLESNVRKVVSDENKDLALEKAAELIDLSAKVEKIEKRAIKQGLDLQGGTYLVYEADIPKKSLKPA